MPDLVLAMASVLGMWLATGCLVTGLGLFVRSAFDKQRLESDDLFRCFWLGFAVMLGVLQLWHLGLPVDWRASTFLAIVGVGGVLQSRKELLPLFRTPMRKVPWIFAAFLLGLILWLADLALAAPDFFDSGNYHMTAIRWATDLPIAAGLGNLDTHFAFNNSTFLYQAALERGFWHGRSSHIGNGLLLVVLLIFSFAKMRQVFLQRTFADLSLMAPVFFLPLCLLMASDAGTSAMYNPGTDLPAIVVCFVISWLLADFVISRPLETGSRDRFHFLATTTLCAVAPTIKLSLLCYAAAVWLVISIHWWLRADAPRVYRFRAGITSVIVAAYFGVVWITASTILSGYPLFPSPVLPLPVDWRIPRIYADGANWLIVLFARTGYRTDVSAEGFGWVGSWLRSIVHGSRTWGLLPIALILLALLYLLSRRKFRSVDRNRRLELLSILIPGLLTVPVWFFTAPALRFGSVFLWIIGSQLCSLAIEDVAGRNLKLAALVFLGCCLLPCAGPLSAVELASRQPGTSLWRAAKNTLLVAPGPDHGFHPLYRANLVKQKSLYGVECYVPARKDAEDWRDGLVWDCPLPGAGEMNPYLMLRGATLSSGFRIRETNGTWASRNVEAVRKAYLETGGNVGRTAARLGVDPAAVREALQQ
jgi:hypothetical protein